MEQQVDLWDYSKKFIKPHLREKILREMDYLEPEENELAALYIRQYQVFRDVRQQRRIEAIVRNKVSATFFIPRPTHKRLKLMAIDKSTSLQQLLEQAVNKWLVEQGEPSFHSTEE